MPRDACAVIMLTMMILAVTIRLGLTMFADRRRWTLIARLFGPDVWGDVTMSAIAVTVMPWSDVRLVWWTMGWLAAWPLILHAGPTAYPPSMNVVPSDDMGDDWLFEVTPFLKENHPAATLVSRYLDSSWVREPNRHRYGERSDIYYRNGVTLVVGHTTGLGAVIRMHGADYPKTVVDAMATRVLPSPDMRYRCGAVMDPDRFARAVMLCYGAWAVETLSDRMEEYRHPWAHVYDYRYRCRPIIRVFRARASYPIRALEWDAILDHATARYDSTIRRFTWGSGFVQAIRHVGAKLLTRV